MNLIVKDASKCPPGCDNCGTVTSMFLNLGKMIYYPDTAQGRIDVNKLISSCPEGLIEQRGKEQIPSVTVGVG